MGNSYTRLLFLALMIIITSCGVKVEIGNPQEGFNKIKENFQKLSDEINEKSYSEQKEPAFDISGTYSLITDSKKDTPAILFELINEGSYAKIYGKIQRSDFTDEEKEIFSRLQIPLEKVDRFKHEFIIDKGIHTSNEVKENTSTNNGEMAKLYLRSSENEILQGKNFTIEYRIYGIIKKNTNELQGNITLKITHLEYEQGMSILKEDLVPIPFNNEKRSQ